MFLTRLIFSYIDKYVIQKFKEYQNTHIMLNIFF